MLPGRPSKAAPGLPSGPPSWRCCPPADLASGNLPTATQPSRKKIKKSHFKRPIGDEVHQIDAELITGLRQGGGVLGKPLSIALASNLRIDIQLATALRVLKESRFLKGKVNLGRVEYAHHDD